MIRNSKSTEAATDINNIDLETAIQNFLQNRPS